MEHPVGAGFVTNTRDPLKNRIAILATTDVDQDRQNLPLQNINHILPGFQQLYSQF